MRYLGLACDGDGTLTIGGHMAEETVAAMQALRESGRKMILVTGETLTDLAEFPHLKLFDRVVAENGALLVNPASGHKRVLAPPRPAKLLGALRHAKLKSLKSGRVMISTKMSERRTVECVLADLDLEWQIIANRDDAILLPPDINKGIGLAAAAKELQLMPRQIIGMGDAENDCELLKASGYGVAVANAVPLLKECADFVTEGRAGKGVREVINRLLTADRAAMGLAVQRV